MRDRGEHADAQPRRTAFDVDVDVVPVPLQIACVFLGRATLPSRWTAAVRTGTMKIFKVAPVLGDTLDGEPKARGDVNDGVESGGGRRTAEGGAGVRRGTEYAELLRLVRAEGLLDRRVGYYRARIALTVTLFAAGWTVFVWLGPSWWQLVVAAFLAVLFVQLGFLGHDAGHRQVFRSGRHNDLLGLLCANLLIGLSYSWWIEKHNRHHANPNHVERDPDIVAGGVVFTKAQARARRSRIGRWVAHHQAALFFPMLLFEGAALHVAGIVALCAGPAGHARRVEAVLLTAHVVGYLGAVFLVLPPVQAVAFIAVQQGLFGVYLGCSFAPAHKGMLLLGPDDQLDFLRRQVLTSRNIRGGCWVDLAMGGLNYQIEHHLFPSMPSPALRRAQPLVRTFCVRHDLPYEESTLTGSYVLVLRYLREVGAGRSAAAASAGRSA
jgi:fatty acid desaturase